MSPSSPLTLPSRPEFPTQPLLGEEHLPVLITGIAGVAGYHAFKSFRERYGDQVFGQRRQDNRRLTGPGVLGFDLENEAELDAAFREHRFRSVLDAGGTCALKNCEADPIMAHRVNVLTTTHVIRLVQQYGARLVRLSIDLVFGGTRGGTHREGDLPDPVTIYGKTMWQAEQMIEHELPNAMILRISLPMGESFNGHAGAIDWIQHRFRHGRPATLYYDEVRTPTYCQCLDPVFERALAGKESGIFHAGGQRPLSLYEIAQIVNRVGGYDPALLHGCYRLQAGPFPPRAGNVAMDSRSLFEQLDMPSCQAWPADPRWVPDSRTWHFDRTGEAGSVELLEQSLYRRPPKASGL